MKNKILIPILLLSVSHQTFAQALSCGSVWESQSDKVQKGLTPEQKLKLVIIQEAAKKKLAEYILTFAKVDPKTLYADGKVTPDEISDLSEIGTTAQEQEVLLYLAQLVKTNQLRTVLSQAFAMAEEKSKSIPQLAALAQMPAEKKEFIIMSLIGTITATVQLRGLVPETSDVHYREWTELSKEIERKLNEAPKGFQGILHFAKSKWMFAKEVKPLVDGVESFKKRWELIKQATKSIDIIVWSIYDDITGFETVDLLIKKHQENVKVRVIVDGQVAQTPGHREAVKKLQEAGIEVILWQSKLLPFVGQHRKMIIVDGKHVIAGGLNFGDVYSHMNPDSDHWHDLDIYFAGKAVEAAMELYRKLWNKQIDMGIASYKKIEKVQGQQVEPNEQGYRIAVINHEPSAAAASGSTIMMTLLKGIREAKHSIDIENAYIVLFPALKKELQAARERGVKVRIITNSPTSVDEPVVSTPILRSAMQLAELKAQVFLKKGTTLHAKFAIFDGQYTIVMSYNLHPRSERIEGEMATLVESNEFAEQMRQVILNDISINNAHDFSNKEGYELSDSLQIIPVLRLFFDIL